MIAPHTVRLSLPIFCVFPIVQGIVPMVIRQVLNGGEDGLALCGLRLASVTLVAIVRSSEHTSTKITYQLEDHTGQINAHYWLEEGDSINAPQVASNSYVRVYGSARSTEGRKTIMIFRIEPLANVNELTNHLLEVLHARYTAEELAKGAGKAGGFVGDFGAGGRGGQFGGGGQSAPNGLDAKQQLVYDAIKRHGTEQGISMAELKRKFEHMSVAEVV